MSFRKKRQISETSEDLDDPAPQPEEAWYSHHEEPISRSQDNLPQGPGFITDDDSDDDGTNNEDEQHDLPLIGSSPPSKRPRGESWQSEASDCPNPATTSFSEDSDGQQPAPVGGRLQQRLSSQSDDNDGGFTYPPKQVHSRDKAPSHSTPTPRTRGLSTLSNSTSADSADTDDDGGFADGNKQSTAMRIMAAMGYTEGKGLGRQEQGRVEPVEASKQKGFRGLGFNIPALGTPGLKYNPKEEFVVANEEINWLDAPDSNAPTELELQPWMKIGPKKLTIDDETLFTSEVVLQNVLRTKSVFDSLDGKELMKARSRANPFELIRGVFFLNRAAMKMANMDAVFDFMFTNPKDEGGNDLLGPHDLLYFADVCAGPGGFSEYVLWKRKWRAKGIGFTLRGECDFRLEDFFAAPSETFEPFYGINEDGNVYSPGNIDSLYDKVMETTGIGVHFMMADGGFSVDGQENLQEVLSKRLYLCQCLVALRIVRPGGHFVVKLFDLFTPFSAGLIYLMYRCFRRITLHKPNTSRPANSERYLICEFKRDDCDSVIRYMTTINIMLDKLEGNNKDVTEIVPLNTMTEDKNFYEYMVNSNNTLGQRQVVQLLKICAFCEDSTMIETRQHMLREECLKLYQIPDKSRSQPKGMSPGQMAAELLGRSYKFTMQKVTEDLRKSLLGEPRDWMCCAVGSQKDDDVPQPTLFVGMGGMKVFRLETRDRWAQVQGIELPRRTLLVGELIPEFEGGRGNQKRINILHIIDAAYLGDEDLRLLSLSDRLELCETFARAIRGNSVRAKQMYDLYDIASILKDVERREKKNGERCLALPQTDNRQKFIIPGGVLFLSRTTQPWVRVWSKREQLEYFHNTKSRQSEFIVPKDAPAKFSWTYENLRIWWWEEGVKVREDQRFESDERKLQPHAFLKYVNEKKMTERGPR